jgi:predicted acylesterase/phospholipase RssA
MRYADGCSVSPLPVQAARALGAQRVISVNTLCDPCRKPGVGLLDAGLRSSRMMIDEEERADTRSPGESRALCIGVALSWHRHSDRIVRANPRKNPLTRPAHRQ